MRSYIQAICRFAVGVCAVHSATVGAQQLTTPYVANSANNAINEILIDPPVLSQVNTSTNLHAKLTSLTARASYQYNGTLISDIAVNLFGTDQQRGQLIEWVEPTRTFPAPPSILWEPSYLVHPLSGTQKPTSPTGIASDPAGNLYFVHSTNSTQPGSVWLVRWQELSPALAAANNAPWPPQPRVIDRVAGTGATNSRVLEETVVAPIAAGTVSVGDLLVLSRDPAVVWRYALNGGHGLADILDPSCIDCATDVTPLPLLSGATPVTLGDGSLRPFSEFDPTGMDFYGDDLLISTGRGQIVRVDLVLLAASQPNAVTIFADNLGLGKSRVKSGWQGGARAAFVTNQNRGSLLRILEGGSGLEEVTGLQNPEGLALTSAAFEPVVNCIVGTPTGFNGCDPVARDDAIPAASGEEVFQQKISGLNGQAPGAGVTYVPGSNLLQDFCIVSADKVANVLLGLGNVSPKIDDFCPGWGSVVNPTIPPELVSPDEPLVFVETTSPGLVITHGLVQMISEEFNLVPDFDESESCPFFRTAWSPSESNDNAVAVGVDGDPIFEENLTACGSLYRLGRGGSFHMIGPFDVDRIAAPAGTTTDQKLRAYVLGKFDRLAIVMAATRSRPNRVMQQFERCIAAVRRDYDRGLIPATLSGLADCDAIIAATGPGILTSSAFRNPGGDLLWRMRNIAYTIREHAGL